MILHLQTVPARNGMLWIRHGFKVFQRKPLAMAGLFSVFLFAAFLLLLVPGIGGVLLLMVLPLRSLGFMLATHQVLQNQTPTMAVYLAPLQLTRERRNAQLMLCALFAAAALLMGLLADWIDGGSFEAMFKLITHGGSAEQLEAIASPQFFWGGISRAVLAVALSVPFWHAPALVHWGGQGVLQALFSSTLGVWRNRSAFAWNALLWVAITFTASSLCSLLVVLVGEPQLLTLLILPLGLMLSTVFYASLYFTFVDCFMFGTPEGLLSEST